jgi:hypothetical protein
MVEPLAKRREVQHGVRIGDDKRRGPRQRGDGEAAERAESGATGEQQRERGAYQGQQHDTAGVLRRTGQADADAGQGVIAPAAAPHHARDAVEREGDRREGGHVVEGQV